MESKRFCLLISVFIICNEKATGQTSLPDAITPTVIHFWKHTYLYNPASAAYSGPKTVTAVVSSSFVRENLERNFISAAYEQPLNKWSNISVNFNRLQPSLYTNPASLNDISLGYNLAKPLSFGIISFGISASARYHNIFAAHENILVGMAPWAAVYFLTILIV